MHFGSSGQRSVGELGTEGNQTAWPAFTWLSVRLFSFEKLSYVNGFGLLSP